MVTHVLSTHRMLIQKTIKAAVDYLVTPWSGGCRPYQDYRYLWLGWGIPWMQLPSILVSRWLLLHQPCMTCLVLQGNGYFDDQDNEEARYQARLALAKQRTLDTNWRNATSRWGAWCFCQKMLHTLWKDYFDNYKQPRGYHARSLNSNNGWAVPEQYKLCANTRFLYYTDEIRNAVLVIHGGTAHSLLHGKRCFWKTHRR